MSELYDEVLGRLLESLDALGESAALVDAAMTGDAALAAALDGPSRPIVAPPGGLAPPAHRGIWLDRVTVAGFRGVGPEVALTLDPTPGLVLVVGRNGSGKSSVAEGLELLLTGRSARFEGGTKDWQKGWRNLACPQPRIAGRFVVEGAGALTIERTWPEGAELDQSVASTGGRAADAFVAGRAYRPILGTHDIQHMHDGGPSAAFDALKGILGLEEVAGAVARLAAARRVVEKGVADGKNAVKELRAQIADRDAPWAETAKALLSRRAPDLDAVAAALTGPPDPPEVAAWRRLVAEALPDPARADAVTQALRDAIADVEALAATAAEIDRRAAELLDAALAWHAAHGPGDCPVCGSPGVIDAAWSDGARAASAARRRAAAAADGARRACDEAERAARVFAVDPTLAGLALADHVDATLPARIAARDAAGVALAAREGAWRLVAGPLEAALGRARAGQAAAGRLDRLARAEDWLTAVEEELRDARFAPIAARAQAIWGRLKQTSSVELANVALRGRGNRRKVDLDVTIDGAEAVALSVMSQGELNALALALFLPRATLPESPFRFVIVDDPVQAMDPGKVDGLARVLGEAAQERQVIVFTHDPRLPEAARRLRIPARVVEVSRRPGSNVEVRDLRDPVEQYLWDAGAVARGIGLGPDLGRRVVPGLCRSAVEARLSAAVWRRCLSRGDAYEDVQRRITDAPSAHALAAVALFDDPARGADVYAELNRGRAGAAATFKVLKEHAHKAYPGDLEALVADTRGVLAALDRRLS